MTEASFGRGMHRLKQVFGAKLYPPEREVVIARAMRVLTDQDFEDLVTDLIGTCRNAPLLDDFKKHGKSMLDMRYKELEQRNVRELEERRERGDYCRWCNDFGRVSALHKRKPRATSYSFRCPDVGCIAAKIKCATREVRWSDRFEGDFHLVGMNTTVHAAGWSLFGKPDFSPKKPHRVSSLEKAEMDLNQLTEE